MLIGQGANHPRVKKAEPDQMVAALKAQDISVVFMVYADECQVFQQPESRASFFAAAEHLFGNCLGSRVEPVGDDNRGTNFGIVEGGSLLGQEYHLTLLFLAMGPAIGNHRVEENRRG